MTYTPNTWNVGDKITKTKLDNLEQGVANALDAVSASTTFLPLPTGTKTTGKAPVVQSDGTVAWATVPGGSGSFTDGTL